MNAIEQKIIEHLRARIWSDHQRDELNGQTRLLDSGILDSMELTTLVSYLESQFAFDVPDDEIVPENFQTPESIANLVARLSGASLDKS